MATPREILAAKLLAASDGKRALTCLAALDVAIADGNESAAYAYAQVAVLWARWAATNARPALEATR